jgi:hypothetical protein
VREGVGLVLLFLFAAATFGFVAYVYMEPDDQPIHNGDTPTLPVPTKATLPPGVIPVPAT